MGQGHICLTCGIEKPSPGGLAVHELIHLSEATAPAPPPLVEPSTKKPAPKPAPKPKPKAKPKDKANRHGAQGRRRWTLATLQPTASLTALLVVANLLGGMAVVLSHSSIV